MTTKQEMKEEITRLKAEVERLTVEADWKTPARKIQALEAEVERLRSSSFVTAVPVEEYEKLKADFHQAHDERADYAKDVSFLKAEVERLRKAGDELSWAFAFAVSRDDGKESGLIKAWRAAKEGNQL